MITAPPINRTPGGLLGFLGIKNGGRNPDTLATTLAPVWDLSKTYLRTNLILARINVATVAVGFTSAGTVPPGEAWYLSNAWVNSQAAMGAGQAIACFGAAAQVDGVSFNLAALTNRAASTGTGTVAAAGSARDYQLLPPGTQLGIYCDALTAGPVTMVLQLWYSRFDV